MFLNVKLLPIFEIYFCFFEMPLDKIDFSKLRLGLDAITVLTMNQIIFQWKFEVFSLGYLTLSKTEKKSETYL